MPEHFKMNVGPGRAPGTAHQRNDIASANQITHIHQILFIVRVTGTESVTV
jgi:hypothetical protein